jgi:hypothetical protein
MRDAGEHTATDQAGDGVFGDLQHDCRLRHGVNGRLRLADSAEVGAQESFDGSLHDLLDELFDRGHTHAEIEASTGHAGRQLD